MAGFQPNLPNYTLPASWHGWNSLVVQKDTYKPALLPFTFIMYPNHYFYPPQPPNIPSQSTLSAPKSTYPLHPTVYPGTSSNYAEFNTNWGVEQVDTFLHIANQMNGEPSSAGTTAIANNDTSYQCRWITGGIPCTQGFANFDDLIVHLGRVHDVQGPAARKMICQWQLREGWHCGKEYRRDGFRRHIGTHVGLSVPCPGCDKRFSREDSMRAHWRKQHGKA